MNTMSNEDRDKIRRVINSVYGATSGKFNLEMKMTDKPKCNYYTTSTNNTGINTFNPFESHYVNTNIESLYPQSLFMSGYVDTDIVSKKGVENKMISKIEVKGKDKNVIIVHFEDGDIQKAVCLPNDMASFDIATGVMICIAKHSCGGSSKLHKLVKTAVNNYYTEEYNKTLKAKQEADAKIKAEEKAKKRKEYLENKRKKESEQRIEEIKEAILRATKEQITEYYEEGENE